MQTELDPHVPEHPAGPPPAQRGRFQWVPIRSLAPRHRPRVLAHLLGLNDADRYLRFGHVATDEQIGRYVEHLDFERDEIFGVFNRHLALIAMAHLAYMSDGPGPGAQAEFGVSVVDRSRGRGLGARLFDHAILHARNRRVDTLIVHALTENTAMLRMARRAGARIQHDGPDSMACLKLPPEDLASQLEAMVEGHAAALDYGLKRHARRIDALWHRFTDSTPGTGDAAATPHTQARGSDAPP